MARHCFFTMELVDGVNFVEYVRGSWTVGRAGRCRTNEARPSAARQRARRAASTRQAAPGRQAVQYPRHRRGTRGRARLRPHERRVPARTPRRANAWPARPPIWRQSDGQGSRPPTARTGTASASRCTKRSPVACPSMGRPRTRVAARANPIRRHPRRSSRGFPTISTRSVMGLLCRDPERRLSGRDALEKLDESGGDAAETTSARAAHADAHLCRPHATAGHPDRVVRRRERRRRGDGLHSRPVRHRQDGAGRAVPRAGGARRPGGGPARPMLPARVGAVRGPRRDRRQSESAPARAPAGAGGGARPAGRRRVGPRVPRDAASQGGGARAACGDGAARTLPRSAAWRSRRSASS